MERGKQRIAKKEVTINKNGNKIKCKEGRKEGKGSNDRSLRVNKSGEEKKLIIKK